VACTNLSLGSPTSWYWQFGDGAFSTLENPIHTYTIPGIYTVTLRATNDRTGGIAELEDAVTVTNGMVPTHIK
jgi:PKD repeat protein